MIFTPAELAANLEQSPFSESCVYLPASEAPVELRTRPRRAWQVRWDNLITRDSM